MAGSDLPQGSERGPSIVLTRRVTPEAMLRVLLARLPRRHKNKLRRWRSVWREAWASTFRSFGPQELLAALRAIGVREGDSLMLHSAFSPHSGWRGSPSQVTDTFLSAVGPRGHLLMVSLPYRTSSREYLANLACFDVRKTPSSMGLISEFFRQREDVVRSLHPTHPVLACGPRADWIIACHERCLYPCGPGTPFDKLIELSAKVLFFDAPFAAFTLFHNLEHRVRDQLGFPLYDGELHEVPVIDREGRKTHVRTHVFSEQAIRRRRFPILENELRANGIIARQRVGNAVVLRVEVAEVIRHVDDMTRRGVFFYDRTGLDHPSRLVASPERP